MTEPTSPVSPNPVSPSTVSPSTGPSYRVPLAELLQRSRVDPEDLVEEQAGITPPHGRSYDSDATGMGMPRLAGAPMY